MSTDEAQVTVPEILDNKNAINILMSKIAVSDKKISELTDSIVELEKEFQLLRARKKNLIERRNEYYSLTRLIVFLLMMMTSVYYLVK